MLAADGVEVTCCPAQARLLLLFREESLPLAEVLRRSPFSPEATMTILQSLSCCECVGSVVYCRKLTRSVELPPLASLPALWTVKAEESSLLDEETRAAAKIMHLLKRKKRLSLQAIERAVGGEAKRVVESLLEKEYVARDPKNACMIVLWCVCWYVNGGVGEWYIDVCAYYTQFTGLIVLSLCWNAHVVHILIQ